ncbi:protocadherin-8-like [Syngnathoides biaculeatus]|uniref:protocadherin-8-like n=1 Tax=Syngnathoides biaculeatus TaxID=300417 RepID=UPI002ADE59C0|nr:protocadherin-8-like [Syngnathoides biaculeatus]
MRPSGWLPLLLLPPLLSLAALAEAKTVKYQTWEEDAPGAPIGNLRDDVPSASRSTFRMMKQSNSSFVRLRESDGQLSVGERIDRERLCKRAPRCLVSFDAVAFSREHLALIRVEVEVKDINDNSPAFPRRESGVDISENAAVGTRVPLDFATDEDVGLNYIQSYQISVNGHFSVDVLSRADGVKYAQLVLVKELDRETRASHALELVAVDGGNPPRSGSTRVTVKVKDYNDNSPVFERDSYRVDLSEDAPAGSPLLRLNAEDPDEGPNGQVVYGLGSQAPPEIRRLFRVDRKSGELTLESPVDFESKNTYEFDVQASDLGSDPSPAVCKIVVQVRDVNDNAPEISVAPVTSAAADVACVSEAAAVETFVALVSTSDRDSGANGRVRCALYGHRHFRLQQAYQDSFMIVSAGPLDREKIPEYNLTLVAEDSGSPPLRTVAQYTVRLTDENDNAPAFGEPAYEVAVAENNAPGAYVATVTARDADAGPNGKVTYELSDGVFMGSPISTFVSMDPASGSLYALRSFNYEVMKQLELRVTASDGGSPPLTGSAHVFLKVVDQNDNAPAITRPALNDGWAEVLLPRDAPSGYVVTRVEARDADEGANSELSFGLAAGEHSAFSVDKLTGDVHLNRLLGRDADDALSVTVTVSDNGRPALTSTAALRFVVVGGVGAGSPPGDRPVRRWDPSVVVIVILAGSCTLLLLAIILIATTCKRHRADKSGEDGDSYGEKGGPERAPDADAVSASEVPCVYDSEPESNVRRNNREGYSTLPGYGDGKEAAGPVAIWKGNSRDPTFSAKDSGKGDSDFNDSDSDVSADAAGFKKVPTTLAQNALWACTSECKVLGHSDRCWSPSAASSLPRDPRRRENCHRAHIPKTAGLQSVYEKVLDGVYDYAGPAGGREACGDASVPAYAAGRDREA